MRGRRESEILARCEGVCTHGAGVDGHDLDAEGSHFQPKGVRDGSLRCLGACIYACVCAWFPLSKTIVASGVHFRDMGPLTHPWRVDARRYGADVHDGALGGDDEVREGLGHADHAPDIDVVHVFGGFDVEVEGRHDDGLTGIVD